MTRDTQRFLLPRIIASNQARLSLKQHQQGLFIRLLESATSLKAKQEESYVNIPRPNAHTELSHWASCTSFSAMEKVMEADSKVQPQEQTILRCAIEELKAAEKDATTENIFDLVHKKMTWVSQLELSQTQVS